MKHHIGIGPLSPTLHGGPVSNSSISGSHSAFFPPILSASPRDDSQAIKPIPSNGFIKIGDPSALEELRELAHSSSGTRIR